VVAAMQEAAASERFEIAARWREKFEQLEWLLAATSRARSAIDLLTFVYRDPGDFGDDRIYVLRQGVVRASYPNPSTPIEHEAFRAVVAEEARQPAAAGGQLPMDAIDEVLLMMAWFRAHPDALRRATPYEQWM
jgi:UvrB/uvrC motif